MSAGLRRQLPFVALAIFLVLFATVAPHGIVDIGVYALIYGLAAMGLAAVGAVLHGMFARPNTVSPREEVEAEHLVQKARPTAVDR